MSIAATIPHRRLTRLVVLCLLPLLPLCAGAQEQPYLIRPGDTLNIQVVGQAEWSLQAIVRPDGRISYPGLGEMTVADRTIQQITAQIVDALGPGGRHLKNPQVIVNASSMRPLMVYVLGAVARPGTVEVPTGAEAAKKVLALVGGAQPQADLRAVVLYRGSEPRKTLDLQAQVTGDAADDILRTGDVMVVPELEQRVVGVMGAVSRSGQYALKPQQDSIDLVDLVLLVGGLAPNIDKDRALLLRTAGAVEVVPIDNVMQRKAPAVKLAAGDVLWVLPKPDTEYFAVTGAVHGPGRYEYRQGLGLADALALAAQPLDTAETKSVMLIHKDGSRETLNIRPMLEGKDAEMARRPVKADDIILVPIQWESYVVLGAVGRAGSYPWEEKTKLSDALAAAGGPAERVADMAHVVLVRRNPEGKKPTVMELDARELLTGKNEAANWTLRAGDTVYVPALQEKGWREKLETPLFLMGIASTLLNLFN